MNSKLNIWNGIYDEWPSISAENEFYDSQVWTSRIDQQLSEYLEMRSQYGCKPPRGSSLPWVMADKTLREVLDFGGASGWQYLYLSDTCDVRHIKRYTILERKEVADKFANHPSLKEGIGVHYICDLIDVQPCDLLYVNSVLQYFEHLNYFSELIKKANPKKILIDDAFIGEFKTFFSKQTAYNFEIPCSFMNRQYLIGVLNSCGYIMTLDVPFLSPIRGIVSRLPMDNFPENYRIEHPRSLLFTRT